MLESVESVLSDQSVSSLQRRLLEAHQRIAYLSGRNDQLNTQMNSGGIGGADMNPLMLMAAMGRGGGGGDAGMERIAQMMLLQQAGSPMMAAASGIDLKNPTAILGGLQGGASDVALSPFARKNSSGIDPLALLALVRGKGDLAAMLEQELSLADKDETLPLRMKKFFEPGAPQVVVRARALKLPKRIGLDKIDAFLRVTVATTGALLVQTNQVKNTATPQWNAFSISSEACKGLDTPLRWEVFDWEGSGQHRTLGGVVASLNDIIRTSEFQLTSLSDEDVVGGKKKRKSVAVTGSLVFAAEEKPGEMIPFALSLHLSMTGLDNRDGPGDRSDPFFAVYLDDPPQFEDWNGIENMEVGVQENNGQEALGGASASYVALNEAAPLSFGDGDDEDEPEAFKDAPWHLREDLRDRGYLIYVSEVVRDELNPSFLPARIDVTAVGSLDVPIRIEVWDFDDDSRHDFLGSVRLPGLRALLQPGTEWPIVNSRRLFKKIGRNRNNGVLRVSNALSYALPESRPQQDPNFFRFQFKLAQLGHGRKMDVVGKGDPFFVIYASQNPFQPQVPIYRSEMFTNTKEAIFKPVELEVSWVGGLDAPWRVVVFDFDKNYKHDYIGEVEFTFRQLTWGLKDYFLQRRDKKTIMHYSGSLRIESSKPQIRKAVFPPTHIELVLMFQHMRKKEITRNDPFFTVSHAGQVVYTSEVFKNLGSQAMFKPFKLALSGRISLHSPLTIEVFDWNQSGKHSSIGCVTVTLLELSSWKNQATYALWHRERGEKKSIMKTGLMTVVLYKEKLRGQRKHLKNLLALVGIDEQQTVMEGQGNGMEMAYVSAENVALEDMKDEDDVEPLVPAGQEVIRL